MEIIFKWDYDGAAPVASDCDFSADAFADFDSYVVNYWTYALPTVMAPGASVSCTVTYDVTSSDIAYGGLWTVLAHQDVVGSTSWDYSYWYVVPAAGTNPDVAIVGTPTVGNLLTIDEGLWGPWDAPFDYQWYSDGNPISGADSSTYTVAEGDIGTVLTVTLTSPSIGVTRTSAPTEAVSARPAISDVSPSAGGTGGGTTVTLTGSAFTGATSVTFDGSAGTSVSVDSDTQITVTTPAHAAGAVDVVVTTPVGSSPAGTFTFVTPSPAITDVSPESGSTDGGTSVTITGTHFTGATSVTFDGVRGFELVGGSDT